MRRIGMDSVLSWHVPQMTKQKEKFQVLKKKITDGWNEDSENKWPNRTTKHSLMTVKNGRNRTRINGKKRWRPAICAGVDAFPSWVRSRFGRRRKTWTIVSTVALRLLIKRRVYNWHFWTFTSRQTLDIQTKRDFSQDYEHSFIVSGHLEEKIPKCNFSEEECRSWWKAWKSFLFAHQKFQKLNIASSEMQITDKLNKQIIKSLEK